MQIPNSKIQIPNKFEIPIPNDQKDFVWNLNLGPLGIVWDLVLGVWYLEFGASPLVPEQRFLASLGMTGITLGSGFQHLLR